MWKRVLFVLLLGMAVSKDIASVLYVHDTVAINKFGNAYPQSCNVDGKEVYLFTTTTEKLNERGAGLAMATQGSSGRAVWVDRNFFFDKRLTPEFQHFVLHHECAHHELGHTENAAAFQGDDSLEEVEADCRAVHRLVEQGFGPREFKIIFQQVGDEELMNTMSVSTEADERYKSLTDRVKDLKDCLEHVHDN